MKPEDTILGRPLPETQAPASGSGAAVDRDDGRRQAGRARRRVRPRERLGHLSVGRHAARHAARRDPACPHAHAMVKKVDTSAAEKMPGVQRDPQGRRRRAPTSRGSRRGGFASRLFDPHCRYEGDEVAAVAADTIYQAWDAVRAIKVEYDVLPHAVTSDEALKPDAPAVRDGGNTRAGRRQAVRARRRRGGLQDGRRRASSTRSRTPCETAQPDGAARLRGEVGRRHA